MREETFGRTLPVMKVADADEAGAASRNDSKYGLSSSVYTKDVRKGEAIARRLRAGNTAVNDGYVHVVGWEAPFGGSRDSGVGARNGREGILKYTEPHTIMVTRLGLKKDIGWASKFQADDEAARARVQPLLRAIVNLRSLQVPKHPAERQAAVDRSRCSRLTGTRSPVRAGHRPSSRSRIRRATAAQAKLVRASGDRAAPAAAVGLRRERDVVRGLARDEDAVDDVDNAVRGHSRPG